MTALLENQPTPSESTTPSLFESWPQLSLEVRLTKFHEMPRLEAEDLFLSLDNGNKAEIVQALPYTERRAWVRLLAPDDAVDVVQSCALEERQRLLELLDDQTRKEVTALLAYAEDDAGGLMNPRYARIRVDMTVDEAISYLRKQTRDRVENLYYLYVLGSDQRLRGVVSFRDLFMAPVNSPVQQIMQTDLVTATEQMDQEQLSHLFAQHDLMAIPVVDDNGVMKGIVTVDDIVDVVQEEATEDIQKMGATEALRAPYFRISVRHMIRKRASWLSILFVGEMLTATAMAFFEHEIARAVVLALFIPLIISSGGNSGSQASTLIIRAMALGEVKLRDWWRIIWRELASGLVLGSILGSMGFLRVILWPARVQLYGEHYILVGLTVAGSLVGVVTFGTVCGSMLPFILKRCGLDPASASAPLVATLVDVTGLVIYFAVASAILTGTLL